MLLAANFQNRSFSLKKRKEQIRIESISDNFFMEARVLYENYFPLEAQRSIDSQAKVFKNFNYNFDVAIKEEQFIGYILW